MPEIEIAKQKTNFKRKAFLFVNVFRTLLLLFQELKLINDSMNDFNMNNNMCRKRLGDVQRVEDETSNEMNLVIEHLAVLRNRDPRK